MIHNLQQWMGHSPSETHQKPLSPSSLHKNLQTAIQHQDEIGWANFIRGGVAKQWYLVQKDYPLSKNSLNWQKNTYWNNTQRFRLNMDSKKHTQIWRNYPKSKPQSTTPSTKNNPSLPNLQDHN